MNNIKQIFFRGYYQSKYYVSDNKFIILFFVFLFTVRFQISFLNYLDFKYHRFLTVDAKVVNQYKKQGKRGKYYVLKLKTKTMAFYTTSRENLKNLLNENIRLTIITSKISFWDYLFTFYAPSFNLRLLPVSFADEYIEKQHKNAEITNIFKALFLGESIDSKTRQELSTLGIAHLIALSGLHLGFISLFLFLLLSPVYKIFQKNFPYRNRYFDLGIVIFVIEFFYLYITGFPPSLIRAFVLEIVVFLYAFYLQNPFSLKILGVVFLLSLLIFGAKVFSIGYFLSITGVFYIYLFFRYFKPTFLNSMLLSFYMFGVMFIISHSFFGNFNLFQLFSSVVNLLFTVFYPVEIFLHFIGYGGIFDGFILKYLHLGGQFISIKFPLYTGVLFLALSFLAFFSKRLFYGINLVSLAVILYVIGVSVV